MLRSLILALLLLGAVPGEGWAHLELESSAPAAGSVVSPPVTELRLRFTRPVEVAYTSVTVFDASGGEVASAALAADPAGEGRGVVLPLAAPLGPGRYTVRWRTAGPDGHVVAGDYSFTVEAPEEPAPAGETEAAPPPREELPPGESPAAEAPAAEGPAAEAPAAPEVAAPAAPEAPVAAGADPAPEAVTPPPPPVVEDPADAFLPGAPLPTGVRWIHFLALLGVIGAVGFRLGVVARLEDTALAERAARRTRGVALAALALSVAALFGRLWVQSSALHGPADAWSPERLGMLLGSTPWGAGWLLQAGAILLFLAGLLFAGWGTAAVAAVLLAAVPALSGHAVAVERWVAVAVASDALHVLGAGLWMGTLALLLGVGIPAALAAPPGERGAGVAAQVLAFSPLALLGAGTAAATGVLSALFHLGAPAELWGSDYGRTLLLKLALLAVAAGAGFFNWRFVAPTLGAEAATRRIRLSAGVEVGAAVLIVLVTAVLVALPTP